MNSATERFLEHHASLHDLQEARGLLEWDQQVMMPPRGVEQRGRQLAILATVLHERLCDPRYGGLLDEVAAGDPDPALAADLREARRARDRALRLPASLVAERARVCSLAEAAWESARAANDFAVFRPHLQRVVELTAEMARCLTPRPAGQPLYQALLEEYEPGMATAALEQLFTELRPGLISLLSRVQASGAPESQALRGRFPLEAQERFCRRLVADMGFDLRAGRLDVSAHPFTAGTLRDVRLTNRYDEENLAVAISGAMHEAGHGLYEQGLDPERYLRPAGGACSLGVHESQSRFWENLVGRSAAFWRCYLPVVCELFPGSFDRTSADELFRASNRVQPSLIRVDADELTYNLHIMLRYRLECALVEEQLPVADLPGAWREAMLRDVGVEPPDDRRGVLQDVHWAAGLFGYFPTYTLGNLFAAQLAEALRRDLPDLDQRLERGELGAVTAWLRRQVHSRGALLPAPELCQAVTGRPLGVAPLLGHLEAKLGAVYDL